MKRTEAFASNYLNQDDLPHSHTAVIKTVGKEMVNTDDNGRRIGPHVRVQYSYRLAGECVLSWSITSTTRSAPW